MTGTVARRPSLRWTTTGHITEPVRQALAEVLGCAFTDETELRTGYGTAPDVETVVIVDGRDLTVVAHFLPVALRFPSTSDVLDIEVRQACARAGLPAPAGPREVVTGR